MRNSGNRLLRSTFAIPAILALVSVVGLLSALLGDGPFDLVSWVGLALPVLAVAWAAGKSG